MMRRSHSLPWSRQSRGRRDGQEALDYLPGDANNPPRLVLLELRLPNIDGLEVLRQIRDHKRTFLTGGDADEFKSAE